MDTSGERDVTLSTLDRTNALNEPDASQGPLALTSAQRVYELGRSSTATGPLHVWMENKSQWELAKEAFHMERGELMVLFAPVILLCTGGDLFGFGEIQTYLWDLWKRGEVGEEHNGIWRDMRHVCT